MGAGTEVVENLNHSADGLIKTWPTRFDAAKAAKFAHDQKGIANEVYNGRMGNRLGSDDGWNYRGRGGSQVTGNNGYTKLGAKVGVNLVNEPELVNTATRFLECAVADFVICGCLPFAAQDDIAGVTYHLNGGFIGLQQRTVWLARWKAALGDPATAGHGTIWVQKALNRLGAVPELTADGVYGPAQQRQLRLSRRQMDWWLMGSWMRRRLRR